MSRVVVLGAGGRMGATACESVAADAALELAAAVDPSAAGRPDPTGTVTVAGSLAEVDPASVDIAVDFTVLGDASDARARALFEAAVRVFEPRKVVRYEAPGVRYPDQGAPAMFICTQHACSSPVSDPEAVAETAARMARVPAPDPCPVP